MKKRGDDLQKLLLSKNTVFTPAELAILWQESDKERIYDKLRKYENSGKLTRIKTGFYAKSKDYNRFEFANKLYKPSYVSLNTVLAIEGVIFQYFESIYSVSYLSRDINVDNQEYIFKCIKEEKMSNPLGIIKKDFYHIASKERAFMDAIYLYQDYYFDNLGSIDWDFCYELAPLYCNKALIKRLDSYFIEYG